MTDPTPPAGGGGGAGTVKVPGIGPVKKQYVYLAVGAVAAYVAYAWWTRSRDAGTELVLDPSTGSLGSESSYTNPNPVESVIDTTGDRIDTNQEWIAKVTEVLGNLGYEAQGLNNIMVRYLAGQKVTQEEAIIIRTAWTWVGYPPDGPRYINTGGTGDPDPDPDPDPPAGGTKLPYPQGFGVPAGVDRMWPDAIEMAWHQVTGAKGYRINDYAHGKTMDVGPVNAWVYRGLIRDGSYHMRIATIAADGTVGDYSPLVAMHTKA